ncbi:MAG: type I pullulanase [Faecousia sp.]
MYAEYSCEEFEKKFTYTGNDLGANWSPNETFFRLWAPTAQSVRVCLYHSGTAGTADFIRSLPMTADQNGTWIARADGDLNGIYYTYLVNANGNMVEACDPYAAAVGVNGKRAMVCNLKSTDPDDWERDCTPVKSRNYTDYAIYELHIRDLSSLASSGITHRGKYLGLAETGTKLKSGEATGLDHIRKLGVTHIHLLPVYDYGSVDEANPGKAYNWGYDPVNFNVPEGSYSTNPFDGFTRIREMKQMIQSVHQNGLGVILDVVYNHVYHTFEFSMNQIVPGYFSRENEEGTLSDGSCCGNDTASERSMVRKFIVDSVSYWADEYHVDGFRFDLVGLLDTITIQEIIASVRRKHPHVMFYGEGWDIATQVTKPNVPLAIQKNAWMIPEFAFFNDTMRDTMRGSVFDYHLPGFISGAPVSKWHLLKCFQGRMDWSCMPSQIVNYVSCHDNHTLHDRIAKALPRAEEAEIAKRCRMAAAFYLLSTGIPFLQAGEEMLRTKKTRSGKYVGNSYRSPDQVNGIKWSRLKEPEVQNTVRYYQGLLSLRGKHRLFRMTDPDAVCRCITLLPGTPDDLTVFQLRDEDEVILAVFNPSGNPVKLTLPEGKWEVYAEENRAGSAVLASVSGETSIAAISAFVAILAQ